MSAKLTEGEIFPREKRCSHISCRCGLSLSLRCRQLPRRGRLAEPVSKRQEYHDASGFCSLDCLLPYSSYYISHRSLWVRAFSQSCAKYVPNWSEVHCINMFERTDVMRVLMRGRVNIFAIETRPQTKRNVRIHTRRTETYARGFWRSIQESSS